MREAYAWLLSSLCSWAATYVRMNNRSVENPVLTWTDYRIITIGGQEKETSMQSRVIREDFMKEAGFGI